jgi:hypothetical protein
MNNSYQSEYLFNNDGFRRVAHGIFKDKGSVLILGLSSKDDAQWFRNLYPQVVAEHELHHMLHESTTRLTQDFSRNHDSFTFLQRINGVFDNICFRNFVVPRTEQLFRTTQQIAQKLNDKGKLVLSFENHNDNSSHVAHYGYLIQLFETCGLLLKTRETIATSENIYNTILGFEKTQTDMSRGLYVIERILADDAKTTTYKYALIRALCRIARNSFHSVRWISADKVAIPMNLLTIEWIRLYWHLIFNDKFIPQGHNEPNKPIVIRKVLMSLLNENSLDKLDLYEFISEITTSSDKYTNLLKSISESIIKGPIKHSGGAGNQHGFSIFQYQPQLDAVTCSSDIWLDICRFEHWIEDSIKIRWANYIKPNNEISRGLILDILEKDSTDQRATRMIRNLFDNPSQSYKLNCVWTNKNLHGTSYDVDHVIPFAIWGNNDLWNLLPTDSKVNNSKTNKIPTGNLIEKQQKQILVYWQFYLQQKPQLFSYQMKNALGCEVTQFAQDWQPRAIYNMIERIEALAQHRGIARWEPN